LILGADIGDKIGAGGALLTADVDGDEIQDILIGSSAANGLGNNMGASGEVAILLGRSSWPANMDLASDADSVIYGPAAGFSITADGALTSGDIDGDEIDDIIIGAQIGSRAFCGLGSVITQDVPPFSTAAGNRARVIGINKEGLKRKGFSPELIRALHSSFRALLKSKGSRQDAFDKLQPLCDKYPEVAEFVDFVKNSKRGIAS